MPNRMLREGLRSSPSINALSDRAARLYSHLLVSADDFGLMEWTPSWVKATAVPLLTWTMEETADVMALIAAGKVVRCYESSGKPYAAIEKWEQRRNAKFPKFPPPPWTKPNGTMEHILGGYVAPRARSEAESAPEKRKAPDRINGSRRRGADTWWATDDGIRAKAAELDIPLRSGETFPDLKIRINAVLAERTRKSA